MLYFKKFPCATHRLWSHIRPAQCRNVEAITVYLVWGHGCAVLSSHEQVAVPHVLITRGARGTAAVVPSRAGVVVIADLPVMVVMVWTDFLVHIAKHHSLSTLDWTSYIFHVLVASFNAIEPSVWRNFTFKMFALFSTYFKLHNTSSSRKNKCMVRTQHLWKTSGWNIYK